MGHIWAIYGYDMGWSMGHIWISYGFDMGHYPPYQTCMMSYTACLLSYLWERYMFRKNPYYSHIWEWYGLWNGMGWLPCRVWYGNSMGASVPYQTHIYGKGMGVAVPYQSHINQYLLHKLCKNYGTTMGKTTCTHSKPIPQLLTGGMQLLKYFPKGESYLRKQPLCAYAFKFFFQIMYTLLYWWLKEI